MTSVNSGEDFQYNSNVTPDYRLEAFDSLEARTGLVYTSKVTRKAFYIGTDGDMHGVSDASGTWRQLPPQERNIWPLASQVNDEFGTASDPANDKIWMFYRTSNGTMHMIHQSAANFWEDAVPLPNSQPTESSLTTSPEPTPTESANTGENTGDNTGETTSPEQPPAASDQSLSTGAKAGLGVGAALAGLVIIGAVLMYVSRSRRQAAGLENGGQPAYHAGQDIKSYDSPKHDGSTHEMPPSNLQLEMTGTEQVWELPAERYYSR